MSALPVGIDQETRDILTRLAERLAAISAGEYAMYELGRKVGKAETAGVVDDEFLAREWLWAFEMGRSVGRAERPLTRTGSRKTRARRVTRTVRTRVTVGE